MGTFSAFWRVRFFNLVRGLKVANEVLLSVIGILLTVTGFLTVFLLNAIWNSQKATEEKMVTVLSRLEKHELRLDHIDDEIDSIKKDRKS